MHSASVPPLSTPGSSARSCTVCDENGNDLTAALVRWAGGRRLSIESVESRAALLAYYFARGGRRVVIHSEPFALQGRLATRWQNGKRIWWIEPVPPRHVDAAAPMPPPAADQSVGEAAG